MALDLDGLIAGAKPSRFQFRAMAATPSINRPQHMHYRIGIPGAAPIPSAGMAGESMVAPKSGFVSFPDAATGKKNRLARLAASLQGSNGMVMVADRLWQSSGIANVGTAQTVNSVAWPARDQNESTNGEGVFIALEFSSGGSVGGTASISYTNSDGSGGKTAALIHGTLTSGNSDGFYPFALASGDKGVRSVQSITLGSGFGAAAVCHLVAYRLLGLVYVPGLPGAVNDWLQTMIPVVPNGACLFPVVFPNGTSAMRLALLTTVSEVGV